MIDAQFPGTILVCHCCRSSGKKTTVSDPVFNFHRYINLGNVLSIPCAFSVTDAGEVEEGEKKPFIRQRKTIYPS